jgi:predicted TIM-barrel fold metal-dependent hydrolase
MSPPVVFVSSVSTSRGRTLVKGLGADHVLWGTDSVWYGSPQWQIEAMRRLEIPEDMQKKYGFPALGGANSATKQTIFGSNAARLYGLNSTLPKTRGCRPIPRIG